ncbi:uroporphyrinogen-III synthase [Halalkalibacter kiskunsagensis]|uniref:Uroporphyrinogen-III synthase n=1 Tax=Halalkalibacter kiskunsagensis TaxID=1548599 RepID=A0ABV6K857_9BACI
MSSGPLAGKTILVTRAKEQANDLSQLIKNQGGSAVEVPLIAFQPINSKEVGQAIHHLQDYDWLIFTSVNGVHFFMNHYKTLQYDTRFPTIQIAVVGTKTEEALMSYHLSADLVPKDFVAEGLVAALSQTLKKGDRVLVARGNLGRVELIQEATKLGAFVDDLSVYETVYPKRATKQLQSALRCHAKIDYVTFTSSSQVHHYMNALKEIRIDPKEVGAKIACIGPIAARTAKKYDLPVEIIPHTYTIEHLVEQIILDSKEENSR